MRAGKRIRRRDFHYELQGGCCFYCGILMDKGPFAPDAKLPDNACTTEHTIPKGHPLRGQEQRIVAACLRCNRGKNQEFIGLQNTPAAKIWNASIGGHGAGSRELDRDLPLRGYLLQNGQKVPKLVARRVQHKALAVPRDHHEYAQLLTNNHPVQHRDRRLSHPWSRRRRRLAGEQAQRRDKNQEPHLHHSNILPAAAGS